MHIIKITLACFQVDAQSIDNSTPLCDACAGGSLECVKLLLQQGASVNPPLLLSTPLHEAALRGKMMTFAVWSHQLSNFSQRFIGSTAISPISVWPNYYFSPCHSTESKYPLMEHNKVHNGHSFYVSIIFIKKTNAIKCTGIHLLKNLRKTFINWKQNDDVQIVNVWL